MPTITAEDGCPLNVEIEGAENAPVLMLSNSLGTDLHMWDDQAPEFAKHFRLVRWDRRGHGKSGTTKGPYNFALFGRDIINILDALKIKKANWSGVGLSNPPERPQVTGQAATIITAVKASSTGRSTASVRSAKRRPGESPPPSATFRLNIGMKAALNAPSANSARNMLGRRKATKKASEAKPAPT